VNAAGDDARGGRLFDNWRAEKKLEGSFVPDSSKTPEPDGRGGPNGNGTLNSGTGQSMPNTGHDYRLKNLYGWDLRGAEGIYGAPFQNKAYVLPHNLLTDTRTPDMLRAWLTQGDAQTPAFGQVLDEADIKDVVAFLVKTKKGELARPENLFRLEASVPKNYVLLGGGDAARGRERFSSSCATCHGNDGTKLPIDETESLGTLSRSSGYEVWFKISNGQPGTPMGRQVAEASGADSERAILGLLAALCDRKQFPPLSGSTDVPGADPRCGEYAE
jgi:mono/diheme cytochrome c family protein